jgi:hypothetical protein
VRRQTALAGVFAMGAGGSGERTVQPMRNAMLAAIFVGAAAAASGFAVLVAGPGGAPTPPPATAIAGQGPGVLPVVPDTSGVPAGAAGPDRRAELERLARTESAGAAVDQMLAWVDSDDHFARACHNDAHMLGALSARLDGPRAVVHLATTACDFGYIHGVLKATALDAPDDVDPDELVELCYEAPPDVASSCEHGLGHAIPLRDNLSYSEGLAMCRRLDRDETRAQCVNGVMMEFGVNYMYFHDLRSLDPGSLDADGNLKALQLTSDEQQRPCAQLVDDPGPRDMCYRHLHYFWSPELGEDYRRFEQRCLALNDDTYRSCLQSLGAWAWYGEELWADDPLDAHRAALDESCMRLASDIGREFCIYGYVHAVWQSEPNPATIPSLCEFLGAAYEPGCSNSELRFRPRQ